MGKMMLAVNLVNNKVINNFVSNFRGNRLNGVRVIAVGSWSPEMLILWNFLIDLGDCFV